MKYLTHRIAALAVVATATSIAAPARADVAEPPTSFFALIAAPGGLVAAGGIATAVGTGLTIGEDSSTGWAVSSYVFGGLNMVSAGIYFWASGQDDDLATFTLPVAIVNTLTSVANISVAVASSTDGGERDNAGPGPQLSNMRLGVQFVPDVAGASTPSATISGQF